MLHPQAKALLALMEERGVPPTHTLEPRDARRFYLERRHLTQPQAPEVAEVRTLQAQGPHGAIPLRERLATPSCARRRDRDDGVHLNQGGHLCIPNS